MLATRQNQLDNEPIFVACTFKGRALSPKEAFCYPPSLLSLQKIEGLSALMRFAEIFREIQALLPSNRYQVHLIRHESAFIIQSFKNFKSVSLSHVISKAGGLTSLKEFLPITRPTTIVPPDKLSQVLQLLRSISDPLVQVVIAPEIENLKYIVAPSDLMIRFIWNQERGGIEVRPDNAAVYFGAGWFVAEGVYWLNRYFKPNDDKWLQRQLIEGNELIEFLTEYFPESKNRKLPYVCHISYSDQPVCGFDIRTVNAESVEINLIWREPLGSVRKIQSLARHVYVNGTLRPGMIPEEVCRNLPCKSGQFQIVGNRIPLFLRDIWPNISNWANGQIPQLLQEHKILSGKTELILSVQQKEINGIGCPFAVPTFIYEGERAGAFEILSRVDGGAEYIRVQSGWLPVESLRRSQVDYLGRTYDRTSLRPVALSPTQLISIRSKTPPGPWKRVDLDSFQLPKGETPVELALSHLEFLRYWGIPGGLVGQLDSCVNAFAQMLTAFMDRAPTARILVVGSRTALDSISRENWRDEVICFIGNRADKVFDPKRAGIVFAAPKALETIPELIAAQWNICCLLEADNLVKSSSSKLFTNLIACRRHLMIGHFENTGWLQRTSTREALSSVFNAMGQAIDPRIWSYSLCELPDNCLIPSAAEKPRVESATTFEITIKGSTAVAAFSIPERTRIISKSPDQTNAPQVLVSYSTSADKFVFDGRKWADRQEPPAQFVPFMRYWPTYDGMSDDQLSWYFYWRGEVRQARYPDTDLSYIFVLVYELLNNIGIKDAVDGYERLRQLWLNYRGRYPNLDRYLVEWITDYVHVNTCPINKLHIYKQALKLGISPTYPDLLLSEYLGSSLAKLPLNLIENMINYRISKSKFYLEGHQELLADYIPKIIERVNGEMLERSGNGIFDSFKPEESLVISREPFSSAVYPGDRTKITIGIVTPYTQHQQLRGFLTSIVKHSENSFRTIKEYKGRLRGYTLDENIKNTIDQFISGSAAAIKPIQPRPKVIIDLSKVKALTEESDEVRTMLIKDADPIDPILASKGDDFVNAPRIERPPGTPDHLLTDLNEVNAILRMLNDNERRLIQEIMSNGWAISDNALGASLPGILIEPLLDRINKLSLNNIGDLLIADETGMKIITDDFRDEIEYLYRTQTIAADVDHPDLYRGSLPEEWAHLASRLEASHLTVLQILCEGDQVLAQIRKTAETNGTMPEQLIDVINELALDTVGDIIIDSSAPTPVIEDEDLPMVQELLQIKLKG